MTDTATDTETFVPASDTGRPSMPTLFAELYDEWLIPNGIVGWIPKKPTIVVTAGKVMTCPVHRHLDTASSPWAYDLMKRSDLWGPGVGGDADDADTPLVDERTVLVTVPVTDRIRDLCAACGVTLVER